jgi:hypothetical protein
MKRNALLMIAGALTIGLIAAGCGSDNSDDTSTSAALTKEEFLAQGNAICKQGNQEIDAAFGALGKGQPSQAELETTITEKVVPGIQSQIDDLRALSPPEGDADTVNAILDDAQTALDGVEADPSSIATENGSDPFADVNKKVGEYGLTTCAG